MCINFGTANQMVSKSKKGLEETTVKNPMALEEIVCESLKVIEENIIESCRKGDPCSVVGKFSKTIACCNMEIEMYLIK